MTPEQYRQAAYYQQQMAMQRPLLPNPRWHRPEAVPKPAIVVMVIAVALFGGWAAFHATGVGIGLSLTGIALLAVPLAAGDREDLVPRLPGAALVAALWAVAAIRDAGWVVFLCTAAAVVLTPLALAPQRRFGGTAVAVFGGWLEGLAESFRWAKRGRRVKDGDRNATSMRNLWVALITAALLIVFGGLFAAADSTFADLVVRLLPEINAAEFILRLFFAAFLFPLGLLWAYTSVAKPNYDSARPEGEHRTVSRFELAVPLGALNLLFVAFIAVQLRVFLGGEAYVMETAGLTFAEYARRGFWQLSFVAALALAVIAAAAWLAPKRTQADRWAARILLGTLCALSMVVIASALYRMYTYAETYGLTRMRVWIFTVEIWLAVLFALVIVCCWKLRAAWLPRAVLASGALALLGLTAANPDALIARYNIEHEHQLDVDYLNGLSDDAVPELATLNGEDRDCALDRPWSGEERDLMAWNLGHQRASGVMRDYGDEDRCDRNDMYVDPYGMEETGTDGEAPSVDSQETAEAPAFFSTATCDAYDLASVTTLFGTSATGDRGLENDDAAQFVNEPAPPDGTDAWYLQCGYYGPGSRYLMVEAYGWPTADEADGFVALMQETYEGEPIADAGGTTGGFTASYDSPLSYYYVVAYDELVVQVRLHESAVDDTALAVGQDLAGQTYMRYMELS